MSAKWDLVLFQSVIVQGTIGGLVADRRTPCPTKKCSQ
jgi:hypothetical protein